METVGGQKLAFGRGGPAATQGSGVYSFAAVCLRSFDYIDHVSLSRWSIAPTPSRDTFNIWVVTTFFIYYCGGPYLIPDLRYTQKTYIFRYFYRQ